MLKIDIKNLRDEMYKLNSGDRVLLTGIIYTARDAAHGRIVSLMKNGKELPFPLEDSVIYYAGPTPAKNGLPVGSCGPTTSSRMDGFSPLLIESGLVGMIGKGQRSSAVISAMKKHGAIYFCAVGGAGALASKSIKSCEVIAFPELGCESVKKMYIEDLALIVGIDVRGNNIFER
ncbi:MAG: FumA C-terminus/TtdB family hydratase beta subunit [Clostridia bacterium]|nr:FumA C-terminus/TtdB family hydratase beta subunit [Clostridia bacterium]